MIERKIIAFILAAVLVVSVLSACSGEEADLQKQTSGPDKESSADVSQFKEDAEDQWKESWNETLSGGAEVSVSILANVELLEVDQMSAVEVQRYVFSEENKKKMTDTIFDSDLYYHDEANLTSAEVEEELRVMEEQLDRAEGDERAWVNAQCKKYESLLKKAPGDHVKVKDDYKADAYMGERGGIRYVLSFGEDDEISASLIGMDAHNEEDIYPESLEEGGLYQRWGGGIEREAENKCKISKEEAERQAREFLQNAGFPDLIKTEEEVLVWNKYADKAEDGSVNLCTSDEEGVIDGWSFQFAPGVDGISFLDFDLNMLGYTMESSDEIETRRFELYSYYCNTTVEVTDKGIIRASWESPVMVLTATPGVKLMSLDNIKKIVRDEIRPYLEYCYDKKKLTTIKFNRMSLIYYRVSDPENENLFTYIPAWRLWSNDSGANRPDLIVNAMDGSIVDDWEKTWNITVKTKTKTK